MALARIFYGGTLRRWVRAQRDRAAAARVASAMFLGAPSAEAAWSELDEAMSAPPGLGPSVLGRRSSLDTPAPTPVGKRRARPMGKEAALTAARGPSWAADGQRSMAASEYMEKKAALEAVCSSPSRVHEYLSIMDAMPACDCGGCGGSHRGVCQHDWYVEQRDDLLRSFIADERDCGGGTASSAAGGVAA